ncbi:hypothetical protein BV924_17755 [Pectobacterium odoriferum]|uniref:Uncharacterized protein n=1 Tax=Pectobacterium odoriferum TaxID=78398 RepID=A0ABD6VKV5_9GAMM|nr:hypothetical protein BVY06_17640 [Pectobacterium odoriferum]POE10342.1 hypothetical protein BV924_17755 [Pectobacterium odoriferum]POE24743.1 hypothetical protein BV926_17335 [Pectobacterium odoriferum]POE29562.1 hypothetical protein BV919_17835 [Pectobacterium odoriferum]POE38189.1 hypothetical protein BV920_18165 [Pectobacterium odoriferum]
MALGRHGISEAQIGEMSRAELDGYADALARLNGHKTGKAAPRDTRVVKSLRQKKTANRNKA